MNLHSGTVTFLFSDVEGSTDLLRRLGESAYATVLEQHRRIVRESFSARDGREIDTQGDAFFYAFARARDAVAAAVSAQRGRCLT
jgi:class 3 adenylate cyclase